VPPPRPEPRDDGGCLYLETRLPHHAGVADAEPPTPHCGRARSAGFRSGRHGAGKTTTLRMLRGLSMERREVGMYSGSTFGRDAAEDPRAVGYMSQRCRSMPSIGFENLRFRAEVSLVKKPARGGRGRRLAVGQGHGPAARGIIVRGLGRRLQLADRCWHSSVFCLDEPDGRFDAAGRARRYGASGKRWRRTGAGCDRRHTRPRGGRADCSHAAFLRTGGRAKGRQRRSPDARQRCIPISARRARLATTSPRLPAS